MEEILNYENTYFYIKHFEDDTSIVIIFTPDDSDSSCLRWECDFIRTPTNVYKSTVEIYGPYGLLNLKNILTYFEKGDPKLRHQIMSFVIKSVYNFMDSNIGMTVYIKFLDTTSNRSKIKIYDRLFIRAVDNTIYDTKTYTIEDAVFFESMRPL